jgi:hypothetical protein
MKVRELIEQLNQFDYDLEVEVEVAHKTFGVFNVQPTEVELEMEDGEVVLIQTKWKD